MSTVRSRYRVCLYYIDPTAMPYPARLLDTETNMWLGTWGHRVPGLEYRPFDGERPIDSESRMWPDRLSFCQFRKWARTNNKIIVPDGTYIKREVR